MLGWGTLHPILHSVQQAKRAAASRPVTASRVRPEPYPREMSRPAPLKPPRLSAPELPAHLESATLRAHADLIGALIEGASGDIDAAGAHLSESAVRDIDAGTFDLARSRLADVEIGELRAVTLAAHESRWQSVRMTGGRIATLDLSRGSISGVEIRGVRIDYLTLAGSEASDVLFVDCIIGSLDAPQSVLKRVAFEGCRVTDVDNRGWRAEHVDLRGLEAVHYLDMSALRGTTLSERQATALGRDFAVAAGVDVRG